MSFQPQLWVERAGEAVEFYRSASGAIVLHRVGEGDDIVAQLRVGDASFWISAADPDSGRFSPAELNGGPSRTLLVVDEPDAVMSAAVAAGAIAKAGVDDEHGWRLGRIVDPFGHEWEIGRPIGPWPPD
ncbi:VOC family protein [Microlunatus elymi]|uniref:VOC family protein n=1 Tax=Microlunatus elymi TaxID=2596828 RepID=A0A516Q0W8_9ACTN|nr:VOC family protein [Microlunatus elymi]QDP97070.1 VOC family protein [Microlunatus elymi]